jgi:dihydroorotate dehydrogenase electron transfer subunit
LSYTPSRVVSNEQIHGNYFMLAARTLRKPRKDPLPPQFTMVWVPGVDLIPLSYAYYDGGTAWFFYKVIGDGTKALSLRRPGDMIALSDPAGKSFIPKHNPVFLVGGSGVAPVLHYTKYLERFRGIWGVKYGELAVRLMEKFPKLKLLTIASEDCTYGLCGKLTDVLSEVGLNRDDTVFVAGPTEMVRYVCKELRGSHRGPLLVIAETLVKCGLGICGSCAIDGILLCRDGPLVGCEHFE